MALRRGFKSEAEEISLATRRKLGLDATARLDPMDLAKHRSIKVIGLAEFGRRTGCERAARLLLTKERSSFSAMTIVLGSGRFIVHNERHASTRQASNLAHELAHDILGHPASEGIADGGCRRFDANQEAEADWLAGAVLVPRDGALALARDGMSLEEIAEHFGVSEQMCRFRLQMTGVIRQVERTRDFVRRRKG